MKYWDEFQDKWGFNDGDSVPPDAWQIRWGCLNSAIKRWIKKEKHI